MDKLEVVTNQKGYVMAYCIFKGASSIDGIIVDAPLDMQDFEVKFYCYKIVNGNLKKDLSEEKRLDRIAKRESLLKVLN